MNSERLPPCPVCHADLLDSPRIKVKGGEFKSLRCGACNLIYSHPMRAANAAWYENAAIYKAQTHRLRLGSRDGDAPALRWEFQQVLQKFATPQKLKLLDVGCGNGEFLYWAKRAGFNIAGIDFNKDSLDFARELLRTGNLYNCSVAEAAGRFGQASFDVVTMFEVLEHVEAPIEILRSLADLVRPGGCLCISVPGHERWPRLFDRDVDMPPHHLTLWTSAALRAAFGQIGMPAVEISRKPLRVEDFGIHLRWTAERLRRGRRTSGFDVLKHSSGHHLIKLAAEHLLAPIGWALRLHPRSGGFTLLAQAAKKSNPGGWKSEAAHHV